MQRCVRHDGGRRCSIQGCKNSSAGEVSSKNEYGDPGITRVRVDGVEVNTEDDKNRSIVEKKKTEVSTAANSSSWSHQLPPDTRIVIKSGENVAQHIRQTKSLFPCNKYNIVRMGPFVFHHNYAISCDEGESPFRGKRFLKNHIFETKTPTNLIFLISRFFELVHFSL